MSSNKGSKNKSLSANQIERGGITKVTGKNGSKIELLHPNAGGIDIGATQIYVCGKDGEFQVFDTFTASYQAAIAYLKACGVTTVAMEATGVYWFSLYELLEFSGLEVYLVNGAHARNVPGRKSDAQDCMWLRELHTYGLLRKSFIPQLVF